MSDFEGRFIWYELMTNDSEAARRFYTHVVGWKASEAGGENEGYTILSAGERGVAGISPLCEEARASGARVGWLGYVAVADTDATAERIAAAGGKVLRAPDDIPNVGRFAVVADPQGAPFQLLTPQGGGEMKPLARMAPGNAGWHELYTSDWESGFGFYSGLFGWVKDVPMDMGPMGTYQLIAPSEGAEAFGAMMNAPRPDMPPLWGFYFVVEGIDLAEARVKEAGGQVLMGPMEVPDGSWVIQGRDPEGAAFALVSAAR